jgi:hypothetical protein
MVFWKRKLHKLPKFPPNVIPTFYSLCQVVGEEEISALREAVNHSFRALEGTADDNHYVDLETARDLEELCYFLLSVYKEYPQIKQRLIVGAVRYIAIAEDPFDDSIFASGYFDDKRILNFVLNELGIEGKFLKVD